MERGKTEEAKKSRGDGERGEIKEEKGREIGVGKKEGGSRSLELKQFSEPLLSFLFLFFRCFFLFRP